MESISAKRELVSREPQFESARTPTPSLSHPPNPNRITHSLPSPQLQSVQSSYEHFCRTPPHSNNILSPLPHDLLILLHRVPSRLLPLQVLEVLLRRPTRARISSSYRRKRGGRRTYTNPCASMRCSLRICVVPVSAHPPTSTLLKKTARKIKAHLLNTRSSLNRDLDPLLLLLAQQPPRLASSSDVLLRDRFDSSGFERLGCCES